MTAQARRILLAIILAFLVIIVVSGTWAWNHGFNVVSNPLHLLDTAATSTDTSDTAREEQLRGLTQDIRNARAKLSTNQNLDIEQSRALLSALEQEADAEAKNTAEKKLAAESARQRVKAAEDETAKLAAGRKRRASERRFIAPVTKKITLPTRAKLCPCPSSSR